MICSCFRLQCPTLPALFSFTHQGKICWKDPLCPSSTVLLEHPVHHRHAVFVWLLWGSPLCAWAFHMSLCTCPCAHVPAATSKEQGRSRKGKENGRGLFSAVLSFSPTTSAGGCGKRDILLTDQPSWGKAVIRTPEH